MANIIFPFEGQCKILWVSFFGVLFRLLCLIAAAPEKQGMVGDFIGTAYLWPVSKIDWKYCKGSR